MQSGGNPPSPTPTDPLASVRTYLSAPAAAGGAGKQGCRFSLKLMNVLVLMAFAAVPALALWLTSWRTSNSLMLKMQDLTDSSLQDISDQLRTSLKASAATAMADTVQAAEQAANVTRIHLMSDGTVQGSGNSTNLDAVLAHYSTLFSVARGHSWVSMAQINRFIGLDPANPTGQSVSAHAESLAIFPVNVNFLTQATEMIFYGVATGLNTNRTTNLLEISMLDKDLGTPSIFLNMTQAASRLSFLVTNAPVCYWTNTITFMILTGLPLATVTCSVRAPGGQVGWAVDLSMSTYSLSTFLKSLLPNSEDRLFVILNTAQGVLLGASHGKFFSHSDLDLPNNNPLINPPPLEDFRLYTALNSTDATIAAAGQWALSTYQGWDKIPEVNQVVPLNGGAFWVETVRVTSQAGMKCQVFLLLDQATRLGAVERNNKDADDSIAKTNILLIVLFVVVLVAACAAAVVISTALSRPLQNLTQGMNKLAVLDLGEVQRSESSVFAEVRACQHSFAALNRGLEGFSRYVPRDVVRMMLSGVLDQDSGMGWRVVTVMFSDIAGFTPICEALSTEVVMRLTTEYFQSMCSVIVANGGTLDKFIGDCIMAIWNAPTSLPHHERAAC
eukprot:RCo021175